jgi:hypothetical protein
MVFDEERAVEIVKEFGLNESTIKVWRTRGKIPDRYFRAGFQIKEKAKGEQDDQSFRDIKKIFSYGKINIVTAGRMMGINEYRLRDILYKDIIPLKEELLAIKKAIRLFRIEAKEILSLLNRERTSEIGLNKMKAFLHRNEINRVVFLGNKEIAKAIADLTYGKRVVFPKEYENDVVQAFAVFITETNMF